MIVNSFRTIIINADFDRAISIIPICIRGANTERNIKGLVMIGCNAMIQIIRQREFISAIRINLERKDRC